MPEEHELGTKATHSPQKTLDRIESLLEQRSAADGASTPENLLARIRAEVYSSTALVLKPIEELRGCHFLVEDYQRGYRWTEREVNALLEDIATFEPGGVGKFYCLQPVVVKRRCENGAQRWELIDGQQRITTLYMVLHFLERGAPWEITYRTRAGSSEFLKQHIGDDLTQAASWDAYAESHADLDNIESYHFFNAYRSIAKWFESSAVDKASWQQKLLKHTQVIWYVAEATKPDETEGNVDSIEIFTRLNVGKIPLTNAELIRALFLQSVSSGHNPQILHLKQLEIAQEWDAIERAFQKDDIWCFLNGPSVVGDVASRIEYIFDLLTEKKRSSSDPLHSFLEYSKRLGGDDDATPTRAERVAGEWQEAKQCFYRLQEWFENDALYHRVGIIINRGFAGVRELWEKSTGKDSTRTGFTRFLNERIQRKLLGSLETENDKSSLDSLRYPEHNQEIHDVLLIFNAMEHERAGTRMPFKHYVKGEWSLEHIHAQNSRQLEPENQLAKAKDAIESLSPDEASQLRPPLDKWEKAETDSGRSDAAGEFWQALGKHLGPVDDERMHELTNLVLLGRVDNSSLGNQLFHVKRARIRDLERDMNHFIPLATTRVFAKFYSRSVTQMYRWGEKDRSDYGRALTECLRKFVPNLNGWGDEA